MARTYVNAPLYSKNQYSEAFTARHDEILMDPDLGEEFIERVFKIARIKYRQIVRDSKGQTLPDEAAKEAFDFADKQIECRNYSSRLLITICIALVIVVIAGIVMIFFLKHR